MPVTLAVAFREHNRPPPLPASSAPASAAEPPPLPSMRVPKGAIRHEEEVQPIDVQAAVLKARRATEELEWQAQVKRAKQTLVESEAAEWDLLRTRVAAIPVQTPARPAQPKKPTLRLARAPAALEARPADNVARAPGDKAPMQDEEREWQELRAYARLAEEREWEELMVRARNTSARPAAADWITSAPSAHASKARRQRAVVAWP